MTPKIKKLSYLIVCLLIGAYLTSCNISPGTMPYSKGVAGNAMIVMRDNLWRGALGDSVRQYLTEPVWGLPAPEPAFTLSQHAELNNFLQQFRNILVFNIDPGYEFGNLSYKTDVHARNQLIFTIDAPSADSAIACLYRNKELVISNFVIKDRDAIIADYKRAEEKKISERLLEKFQVDILVPKPYKLDVERDDFVWIAREEGERQWGVLMWKEPYLRTSQLDPDSLIFRMNAMTRRHIPGSVTGSYMADEPAVEASVKRFEKDGIYSVQLNGLWQMENGYMGGPYVNQTIVDIERGQLVTAHGFAYYPNRDKLLMVRQLEAILYTMTPAGELRIEN